MIRCEACGASNPDGAAWCGQCLTRLTPERPGTAAATTTTSPPPPVIDEPPPTPPAVSQEPATPAEAAAPQITGDEITTRGFRRRPDGEMEWACSGCGEYNPLGVDTCSVCGTPFSARWSKPSEPPPSAEVLRSAMVQTAFLPGTGHLTLKRKGSGVLRMVLFLSWALGAIGLVAAGGPVITYAPLILGALAVWALSLADITRLRDGRDELFRGRTAVWVVAGVFALEILGLVTASVSLT